LTGSRSVIAMEKGTPASGTEESLASSGMGRNKGKGVHTPKRKEGLARSNCHQKRRRGNGREDE